MMEVDLIFETCILDVTQDIDRVQRNIYLMNPPLSQTFHDSEVTHTKKPILIS
jgi:hypothetical protein